jgi:hypothetical protein
MAIGAATLGAIGTVATGIGSLVGASKDYSGGGVRLTKLGHTLDTLHMKKRHNYMWRHAKDQGLTPQEFYGSPASGGNPASGAAQALGNAKAAENQVNQKLDAMALQGMEEIGLGMERIKADRDIAKMQTDTQRAIAGVQAETQIKTNRLTNETNKAIADRQYDLARQKIRQIEIPRLMQDLRLGEKQIKLLNNQIATSTEAFTLYIKKLSMGVDNMIVEFLQNEFGFDVTRPETYKNLTEAQKREFLWKTMALQSTAWAEVAGAREIGEENKTVADEAKAHIEALQKKVREFRARIAPKEPGPDRHPESTGAGSYLPRYENYSKDFPYR